MAQDHHPSLLTVIIDTDPLTWYQRSIFGNDSKNIVLSDLIKALSISINSYSLLHRKNKLIVLGNHPDKVHQIFPIDSTPITTDYNALIPHIHQLPTILCDGILKSAEYSSSDTTINKSDQATSMDITKSNLANALSICLCAINKYTHKNSSLQPRILVIQVNKDAAHTYNAVMNSVFSAQKIRVPIDAVLLSKDKSNFLQQACFLTKGIYQHVSDQGDLLQILMTHFMASTNTRNLLTLPLQKSVDFKAACSCHRTTIEFAFMCSVCLTLVCDLHDACPTCCSPARKKSRVTV